MFIYSLSSRLDKLDPYWYGRLLALKAAYLTTGLFIANLVLRPDSPTVTMLMSAIGILLAETPSMNTLDKKDNIYLAWVILVTLTITIFSTTSYMKLAFILTVSGWAYFLYFILRKKPEIFSVVSALLMMGAISQEGLKEGNYFATWNTLLFIFEFSLIAFCLHKLFPFLYHKIWLSSLLRSLEGLINLLKTKDVEQSIKLRKHCMVSLSSLNLLKKQKYYGLSQTIHKEIATLHIYFYNLINNPNCSKDNLNAATRDIEYLLQNIKNICKCDLNPSRLNDDKFYYEKFSELVLTWNRLCEHVNN